MDRFFRKMLGSQYVRFKVDGVVEQMVDTLDIWNVDVFTTDTVIRVRVPVQRSQSAALQVVG